jgi:uncharacterized protein
MSANPIAFWELACHDQDKSAAFFRDVFGWEAILDPALGFYRVNAPAGKNPTHGYVFTPKRAYLPFVAIYIHVDDIRAMRDRVVRFGGHIVMEPEEPSPGSLVCLFNEPSGVTFALIQQK